MPVDQSEILKKAIAALRLDGQLAALLGGVDHIFNHVPQDTPKAYLVVFWQADGPFDTKDSDGFDGSLNHEAVSTHHGDKIVLEIMDRVRAAYKVTPIVLTSGNVVCFDFSSGSGVVQVGETHRATAIYNLLVDEN